MTSAESILSPSPQPSIMFCAILSVLVHGVVLGGLGFMSRLSPTTESVPVIKIRLVPSQLETSSISPAQPSPSFRSASRSIMPPLPSPPPPSGLRTSHLNSTTSPLKPPTTHNSQEPMPHSSEKRVLKDQHAADALVARTLMKLIKPQSTQSSSYSPPQPSSPKLTSDHSQAAHSILEDLSASTQENPAASSFPSSRKILLTRPPGAQSPSSSKVGIVRFVKPIYPAVAKNAGWEGTVMVRVLVQTNGLPGEVTVQATSGHSILDQAALDAVEQWIFNPEKDGNIPIKKYVDIPLKFELHSKQHRG